MLPLQGTWIQSLAGALRTGVLSGVANRTNILGPTEGFLGGSVVKNLPVMHGMWVQSLDQEDPLEKEMATHSSILAWRIPMERGAWRAAVHGAAKSQTQLSD